jgi:rubrerythrin
MSALADRLREIHSPRAEGAEVWVDGPGEQTHRELFPDCTDCEGHEIEVQVCSECGYDHDGDTAFFRSWPCPTITALDGEGTG